MQIKGLVQRSLTILLVTFLTLTLLSSCKKESLETTNLDYQTIAWNYLSAELKATVTTDYRNAEVKDITSDGKRLKAVWFPTTQDALLGPIIVYISVETKVVIGVGPRF